MTSDTNNKLSIIDSVCYGMTEFINRAFGAGYSRKVITEYIAESRNLTPDHAEIVVEARI